MINRERVLKTFLDLVQIDSLSGEEDGVAELLTKRLNALGAETQHDSFGNVIATLRGDGEPLILSAHMDTVQPGHGIKPILDGEWLHSDSSTILAGDPKAGLTAILEGITSIKEAGRPHRSLQAVLTRGEEVGLLGSRNLDYSLVTAKEGFVFDGEGPVNRITIAAPWQYIVEATVIGRAAHAGVEPEKGIPAIRIAAELITRLPQGRLDHETTANVGMIGGGTARNAVPERCWFRGEFRSHDQQKLDQVRREIEDAVHAVRARYPDATVDVQLEPLYDGYVLPENHMTLAFARRVLAALGKEPELVASGGGTDTNNFRLHGIEAVVVGFGGESFHTVRESVHLPSLLDAARFCEAALTLA